MKLRTVLELDDAVACIGDRVLAYRFAKAELERIKAAVLSGERTWQNLRTSEAWLERCVELVNPANGRICPPTCSILHLL